MSEQTYTSVANIEYVSAAHSRFVQSDVPLFTFFRLLRCKVSVSGEKFKGFFNVFAILVFLS